MKKLLLLAICTMLFTSAYAVLPVSAKGGLEFKANGKITHYAEGITSSEVLGGRWDLKIIDGVAEFKGYYRELNKEAPEYSPEGTVDHFKLSYSDHYTHLIEGDVVTVWGTIHYDKKYWVVEDNPWGVDPPGNAPVDWIEDFIVRWVKIEINTATGEFRMDTYPMGNPPDGWNLFGTVLTSH
jgi:hypothetical protein